MKSAAVESRKRGRVRQPWPRVTKESLRLQPRYGAASLDLNVAPTTYEESRLYTAGRALRA